MEYTLKSFNTGQVTLPKKWREQYSTKNFIATETENGLLIQPLEVSSDETVYYENEKGFWVYCESGMDPNDIIKKIKKLQNG